MIPPVPGRLVRWTLDLAGRSDTVVRTPLDDLPAEFPRIDDRHAGVPYRHGWYVANGSGGVQLDANALAHLDLGTGRRTVRRFSTGDTTSEPVFVPRTPDAPEGEGWLLAVIHRAAADRSELLILDAQDIDGEPAATVELPRRVPAGYHGSWVPEAPTQQSG